jgi:excisionase family DNA binding protein
MTAPAVTLESLSAQVAELAARLDAPAPRFLTVDSAARHCDVSADTIRRLLSSGKLTALRPVKGRIVIDRNELDDVVLSSNSRPRRGRGIRSAYLKCVGFESAGPKVKEGEKA